MRFARLASIAAAFATVAAYPAAPPERTGERIVKQQCSQCHATGLHGAPRIDDRAAWVPRMKNGLDATVRSAIKGHGAMPARGGMADLTDTELRSAIVYMFNTAGPPPKPAAPASLATNEKVVDGTEVYLGTTLVKDGIYHVNITLRDAKTHAFIGDAQVEVSVVDPVMGGETRKLERATAGGAVSYASDFRLTGPYPQVINVQVRRPDRPRSIETRFEFKG